MSLRNPLWLISRLLIFGALFLGFSIIANLAHPLHLLDWTTLIAPDTNSIFPIVIGLGMVCIVGIWLGKQAQKAIKPDSSSDLSLEVSDLPSELPPGSAGMLVAGQLRSAHITAQLIDLARRGAITLTQTGDGQYDVAKASGFTGDTDRVDRLLLDILHQTDRLPLNSVMGRAARQHLHFAELLRQPLKAQGLIVEPLSLFGLDPAFSFWLAWATIVLRGMARGLSGSPFRPDLNSPLAILLYLIGAFFLAYGVFGQTSDEPLTQPGQQARKQWRAFYNWLTRAQADPDSAIFERYLPYAIALGAQQRWVEKHASAGRIAAPTWYRLHPRPITGASTAGGTGTRGVEPDRVSLPSLNEMSESLFSSLDQASEGLFGMLNAGASAFERNIPTAPSGGGGGSGFGGPSPRSTGWGSSSLSRGSSRGSTSLSKSRPSSSRGSSSLGRSSSRGSSSLGRSRSGLSTGGAKRSGSSGGRKSSGSSSFRKSSGGSKSGGFRRK